MYLYNSKKKERNSEEIEKFVREQVLLFSTVNYENYFDI